jgi:hypothetical protein
MPSSNTDNDKNNGIILQKNRKRLCFCCERFVRRQLHRRFWLTLFHVNHIEKVRDSPRAPRNKLSDHVYRFITDILACYAHGGSRYFRLPPRDEKRTSVLEHLTTRPTDLGVVNVDHRPASQLEHDMCIQWGQGGSLCARGGQDCDTFDTDANFLFINFLRK